MNITKEELDRLIAVAMSATVGKPTGKVNFVMGSSRTEWEFEDAALTHAGDFQFFLNFSPAKVLELLHALKDAQDAGGAA